MPLRDLFGATLLSVFAIVVVMLAYVFLMLGTGLVDALLSLF